MTKMDLYEKEVSFQADRRRSGVELIKIISDLWYDKSIELVLFRNQLIDRNVSEIAAIVGYGKPSNLAAAFKKRYGVAPKNYRESRFDTHKK